MLHTDFGSPYRNTQQSPVPDRPQFKLTFTITPGAPALPPPPARQAQSQVRSLPPQGELVATPRFSGINQPVTVAGSGFEPGQIYQLNWNTVVGNRMTSAGWEEKSRVIAEAKAGPTAVPNSGSTCRTISAECTISGSTPAATKKQGAYWIMPTALPLMWRAARPVPPSASTSRAWAGARPPTSTPWSTTTRSRATPAPSTARATSRSSCRRPASRGGIHRSLPGDLQGQGDRGRTTTGCRTHLRRRPSGRGPAALPLRF